MLSRFFIFQEGSCSSRRQDSKFMTTPAGMCLPFFFLMHLFLAVRLCLLCAHSLVVASGCYSLLWLLTLVTSLPAGHGP